MNFGLRGLSMSLGPRGANVNIGSRGAYATLGIPGTGISTRSRIGSSSQQRAVKATSTKALTVAFRLQDDGEVEIVYENGEALSPDHAVVARQQNADRLRAWLEEKCDYWNKGIDDLLGIHVDTPDSNQPPAAARRRPYQEPRPLEPIPLKLTLFARIFRSKRQRIEKLNAEALAEHSRQLDAWNSQRAAHDRAETNRLRFFEVDFQPGQAEVQEYLAEVLANLKWPRETTVCFEIDDLLSTVSLDIDLPEIEDMPDKTARVAVRALKINVKDRSAVQRRKEYLTHVHGVLFRVIGEIFAALPRIQRVIASGYSQRPDRKTQAVIDEYLLSVRVARSQWQSRSFSNLKSLDLASCFEEFDLRRNMSVTGVFKPIEPYSG